MKLRKYQHACFVVEDNGQKIVVDPGVYTTDFEPDTSIAAVIITHTHADHYHPPLLEAIRAKNPGVIAVALPEITSQLVGWQTVAAEPGQTAEVGPFILSFFGGSHATIHADIPATGNIGVMINNSIYYPGDSFVPAGQPVKALALPVSAPWLKIGEVMDFLALSKPTLAFPTHDAILSPAGHALVDNLLSQTASRAGSQYQRIDGQTIEI